MPKLTTGGALGGPGLLSVLCFWAFSRSTRKTLVCAKSSEGWTWVACPLEPGSSMGPTSTANPCCVVSTRDSDNMRTVDQNIRFYKSLLDCKVWKGESVLPSCYTRFALSHNCCGFN